MQCPIKYKLLETWKKCCKNRKWQWNFLAPWEWNENEED